MAVSAAAAFVPALACYRFRKLRIVLHFERLEGHVSSFFK
jgi:hypothetical protein